MKLKIWGILCCFIALFLNFSFAQDNTYGDYLIASADKTVSLDLEGAALIDALKMLSQQTGLNFISTEAVGDRALTLYLDGVPLKKAMDIIFKANNLAYEYFPESNIFLVKEMGKPEMELETRVYQLKYARVESSRIATEISNAFAAGGGQEGSSGGTGGEGSEAKAITGAVRNVLSSFGKVTEDPLTNALVVTDVPCQFPVIEQVISKLDIPVPKVMIEVEMLDVSKTLVDQLGVDWPQALVRFVASGTKVTRFPFGGVSGSGGTIEDGGAGFGGGGGVFSETWNLGQWNATRFGPSMLTLIGAELVLDFFRSDTNTKSIARPKILTLSNETAQIKIVTNEAIAIITNQTEGGGTSTSIERVETGTSLKVTPQVDINTGEITMLVVNTVRDTSDSGFTVSGTVSGTVLNPEERSTTSVTRLKTGETLLIGGLIRNDVSDAYTKVPILSKIPFLGKYFFQHQAKTNQDRELLVFLTPRVIEEQPVFAKNSGKMLREQDNFSAKQSRKMALDKLSSK